MDKIKIKWVNYGTASVIDGETIEVNRGLRKYPKLLKRILAHEVTHLNSTKKIDLKEELQSMYCPDNFRDLISFMVYNPSALRDLLPFEIKKKGKHKEIRYNLFLIMVYLITIIIIGGIIIYAL